MNRAMWPIGSPALSLAHLARLGLLTSLLSIDPAVAGIEVEALRIEDRGAGIEITARVPLLRENGIALDAANRLLRGIVETSIHAFKTDFTGIDAPPEDIQDMPPWGLTIDYSTVYESEQLIAVRFEGYDYRGGAHGMPVIEIALMRRADGAPIAPEQLFQPDSNWRPLLAAFCYQDLLAREELSADDDWLGTGTEPTAENYRFLLPEADGLRVIFPPYQVAPYAAGSPEVLVPYDDLRAVLAPALFPNQSTP